MNAIILDTFREAVYRKVFLLMVVGAILWGGFTIYNVHFETADKTGELLVRYHGYKNAFPAEWTITNELTQLNLISQGPWLLFSFFLVAPLLCTYLEKGAIELSFTKGTSRRKIYMGRLIGAFLVYSIPVVLFNIIPLVYFAVHIAIPWARYLDSVLLLMFVFLCAFVIMGASAMSQRGSAITIMAGIGFFGVCNMVEVRHEFRLGDSFLARFIMNWLDLSWLILPKPQELQQQARRMVHYEFTAWFALVTSAIFVVVAVFITVMQLKKRSF